jgi:endo-beta-N-acetylglucosaminidase D
VRLMLVVGPYRSSEYFHSASFDWLWLYMFYLVYAAGSSCEFEVWTAENIHVFLTSIKDGVT